MAKPETWVMIRSRQLDDIEYDLLQAKHAYYCVGKPEMTDAQYDRLEDVLRRERPDSPVLSTVGCGLCYKSS
jgi:NAD-dependent DNA ligase